MTEFFQCTDGDSQIYLTTRHQTAMDHGGLTLPTIPLKKSSSAHSFRKKNKTPVISETNIEMTSFLDENRSLCGDEHNHKHHIDPSKVMTDVNRYIAHMEEEEKRSHPFGVTNVLMNGLNGRKSKTNLDTGRMLTWLCFFCLVIGMCAVVIYLSARAATKAKQENCIKYHINCEELQTSKSPDPDSLDNIIDSLNNKTSSTTFRILSTNDKETRKVRSLMARKLPTIV